MPREGYRAAYLPPAVNKLVERAWKKLGFKNYGQFARKIHADAIAPLYPRYAQKIAEEIGEREKLSSSYSHKRMSEIAKDRWR